MLGLKKSSRKAGLPPGTMIHVGEKRAERVKISLMHYNENRCEEKDDVSAEEAFSMVEASAVTWINISGVHDMEVISALGGLFKLHPLMLEDIVNTSQRTKLEDFGDYIFFVSKMLTHEANSDSISFEQLSIVIGNSYVISFQEESGDVFDRLRERIRNTGGRIRRKRTDYLAYSLIDAIVDNYFIVLERIGDRIEALQERVLSNATPDELSLIQHMRREMVLFRKAVWPLREAVSSLERGENSLITDDVNLYLRDLYDHTIQVLEAVEIFRDMASGILDLYLSSVSNRMNQVMKVLTIIATIFIPLTFIAGIYGMNFENMPELKWTYGYLAVWSLMILIGIVMLIGFRKNKWL